MRSFLSILRRHRGRSSAIKSPELARILGVSERAVRDLTNEARAAGYPVCSGSEGYWWGLTAAEIRETRLHLRSRAVKMIATERGMRNAEMRCLKPQQGGLWQ